MMNPVKWWIDRHPYRPAILNETVEPSVPDEALANLTRESQERSDTRAMESRIFSISVVSLHNDLLKLIEGHRV